MSIMMNMSWAGLTPADYDKAEAEVGWRVHTAAGGRYHVSWFDGDGLRVVDVWDSAEDFDNFVNDRLMPGVAKVGLPGEPEVAIWPLYDLQIEGEPSKGSIIVDGTAVGLPKDAYQALETGADWKNKPPAGAFVHIVGLDGDIMRDVGVWASQTAIDGFMETTVGPVLEAAGVTEELPEEPAFELYKWLDPTKVTSST